MAWQEACCSSSISHTKLEAIYFILLINESHPRLHQILSLDHHQPLNHRARIQLLTLFPTSKHHPQTPHSLIHPHIYSFEQNINQLTNISSQNESHILPQRTPPSSHLPHPSHHHPHPRPLHHLLPQTPHQQIRPHRRHVLPSRHPHPRNDLWR